MSIPSLRGRDAQIIYGAVVFRRLLDSLARPGTINLLEYPTFHGEPPTYFKQATGEAIPLNLYALGAFATLLDGETSFALAAEGRWLDRTSQAAEWLSLRSGAALHVAEKADFAFFCDGGSGGLVCSLFAGSLLEPELSATAFYCVDHLFTLNAASSDVHCLSLILSGPGIQTKSILGITGLERAEIAYIQQMRRSYPTGIDVFLVDAAGHCVGLPRTTQMALLDVTSVSNV